MVNRALQRGLQWAASGMSKEPKRARTRLHKVVATVSGGVGGMFGLPGAAIEMPLTTVVMLRSIAEVARENGFDPTLHYTRLECLQVFAIGGRSKDDDATDSAYFMMRGAHATAVQEASAYMAEKVMEEMMTQAAGRVAQRVAQEAAKDAVTDPAAPALVKIIEEVAKRFGKRVTEATVAKLVPVIGGVGGASMNLLFTSYYQSAARGHFTVLRLQRLYGEEEVEAVYRELEF